MATKHPTTTQMLERLHFDAQNIGDLGLNSVKDLAVLFRTIYGEADEDSEIKRLAGMGVYLADDWARLLESGITDLQAYKAKGGAA